MKARALKSVIVRVSFVVLLAAGIWALFEYIPDAPTSEKQFEIDNADVSVVLQRDGSLLVHEALEFDFNGSFTGAYRDIPLYGGARISGMRVSDDGEKYDPGGNTALGSFDFPGKFGTEEFGGTSDFEGASDSKSNSHYLRVVWHYSALDERRTFDLDYRVTGVANVRDDVVDVTWTPWGDQWEFWLNHLDAQISAASGAAPTHTWLRPRSLGDDATIDGGVAKASVDRIASGEKVGLRAVFPRNAITSTRGAEVDPGDGLAEIEEQEAALDDDVSAAVKIRNWVAENVLAVSIGLGLLGLGGLLLLMFFARERPTDEPEYMPNPPEDIPPALAYALAHEGGYDQRLVLATLLDLVDRGYFEARAAQGKDLDLEIKKAEDRPGSNGLAKYEVATLDFFDRLIGDKWIAVGKMKDEVPKHSTAWKSRWDSLNEKLDEAEKGKVTWDRDLTKWRLWLTLAVTLLFVSVIALEFTRTHRVPIPVGALVLVVGLMISVPSVYLKRLAIGPRQRSAQWKAFENWTRDFPRLDDDPPATLELWRRILVYAVAFGTAERVAKSGRIPEPVAEEAGSAGLWTSYAFYSGSFGNDFDTFGSGFSSQVAPQSSSSGGSGFSGGGGGGFSGGGGGGAW